jgi:hypothetical protein
MGVLPSARWLNPPVEHNLAKMLVRTRRALRNPLLTLRPAPNLPAKLLYIRLLVLVVDADM